MEGEYLFLSFLIFVVGLGIGTLVGFYSIADVPMEKEALNDACIQITGNESAIFVRGNYEDRTADSRGNSKLICELPSFDSTQNIIVRDNSGK